MEYFTELQGIFADIFTVGEDPDTCTTFVIEAEDHSSATDFKFDDSTSGDWTGTGFIDHQSDASTATYNDVNPGKGYHYIDIRYALGGTTDRYLKLTVNGVSQTLLFERTG